MAAIGLASRRKKKAGITVPGPGGTMITQFPDRQASDGSTVPGGTATVGAPGMPAPTDIPSAKGLASAKGEAFRTEANLPVGEREYAGADAEAARGLLGARPTNSEVQDLRTARFAGRMQNKAIERQKAEQSQKDEIASQQEASGTLTVDSASRLGLLGAKSRYSKDFTIIGRDGRPMKTDAGGYVAYLNAQKLARNEADKNRASAETVAGSKGLVKGRYEPVKTKYGKDQETYTVIDTATGQEVPVPGQPDMSGWSEQDKANYGALQSQLSEHQTQIDSGDNRYGFLNLRDRSKALDSISQQMDGIRQKYESGGLASRRPGAVADPAVQSKASVVPQNQKAAGLMTMEEFISDYEKEYGAQPTPSQIDQARGKYWR